jgi:hypothetical protein
MKRKKWYLLATFGLFGGAGVMSVLDWYQDMITMVIPYWPFRIGSIIIGLGFVVLAVISLLKLNVLNAEKNSK